jgi:hypothetical protein
MKMLGFKGFDENLRCQGFQFEVGKTYEINDIVLCRQGFHFCKTLFDVFTFYPNDGANRFCKISAEEYDTDSKKYVTGKITILEELDSKFIGSGWGYGDGYGAGDGSGDGSGSGYGDGSGEGDGCGFGDGDGFGDGSGRG